MILYSSVGIVAIRKDGSYLEMEAEVLGFGSPELFAGNSFFEAINTKEELLKRAKETSFLHDDKLKTYRQLVRKGYKSCELIDVDKFVQKNEIAAVVVYADNHKENEIREREFTWIAYKIGSASATAGFRILPYDFESNDWVTHPQKSEVLAELIPGILDDSPAIRIEEKRVFLCETSAADRLEKELRKYRSIQIRDREILLQIPEEDVLCVDVSGINTFLDISKAKQDFSRAWSHVIRTGGLYDYRDWNRKRSLDYDVLGGMEAVRKALTPEQNSDVPFRYANDPSECCALLGVRQLTVEDSLIKLAEKADKFVDYCRNVPLEAVRRKDGELKMGRYYSQGQYDILLFPRISMFFWGRVVSADTIEMEACEELPERPRENKIVTKEYYGDFEISSDKCLTGYSGDAQDLTLPDWIEKIDHNVFNAQEKLETVRIPDGVKELGTGVFSYCKNIRDVKLSSR